MSIASLSQHYLSQFAARKGLQKLFWNTSWLFAEKVFRMGIGLIVGVWVARYLGPSQFGALNYALAFATLFSVLATLGLNTIVVRDLVRTPAEKDAIMGTTFGLKLCGGIAAMLATVIVAISIRSHDSAAVWLITVTALGMVFSAFDAIDFWFQSQVAARYVVWAKSSVFLMVSLGKVVLLLCGASLVMFAWAGTVEVALGAVGLMIAYWKTGGRVGVWRFELALAKSLLRNSWPLILSGALGLIYLRIAQVMVGRMTSNAELGMYSVAVRLAEAWFFIPMAIVASVAKLFHARLQRLYSLMALTAYAVAVPTTFLAPFIIEALFGRAYQGAAPMLAVLIWGSLFINLATARSAYLTTMNWIRVQLFFNLLGCGASLALNFALIPRYGGMGAVVASCISYAVAGVASSFVYKPLFPTGRMMLKAMIYPKVW
jgi:O-antigen/teichoic acid export membrane protein